MITRYLGFCACLNILFSAAYPRAIFAKGASDCTRFFLGALFYMYEVKFLLSWR